MATKIVNSKLATTSILNSTRRLVNLVHKASIQTESQSGLSVAQHFVLQKLEDGKARSISELAELTHTHQSSVSVVVKKLVDKDLVESKPSATDARKREIRLSKKGVKALATLDAPRLQEQLLQAISRLKKVEKEALAELLQRLIEELQLESEAPSMFFEDN